MNFSILSNILSKMKRNYLLIFLLVFSFIIVFSVFSILKEKNQSSLFPEGFKYYTSEYYTSIAQDNYSKLPRDKEGIIVVDYKGEGFQYNPVSISQFALGNYEAWKEKKDPQSYREFIKHANWLRDNIKIKNSFGVWEYKFDWEPYGLKKPWVSAMAQGQGISVLLRAYKETEEQEYLRVAEMVLKSFQVPVKEGGVSYTDKEGFTWYEEYPSNPPSHVLNGFIFSLFGLYDFYKVTGSNEALELFNKGVETLENHLYLYDTGWWSTYDLWKYNIGERDYTFGFITDNIHPKDSHPIDKIDFIEIFNGSERLLNSLDVGAPDDITEISINRSHLYYLPGKEDWGKSYILDGRTVRNYGDYDGIWHQAPFDFKVTLKDSPKYYIAITYKDISIEPIYLKVLQKKENYFIGKYFRIGRLKGGNTGVWKIDKIEIPYRLLTSKLAGENYHSLHIKQLYSLYNITGRKRFLDFAKKFNSYLNLKVKP